MFNTILSSGGIGNSLGTFDIVVIICVCSIVELFKQKVFHNNAKFKSLCPYITVILAFIIYLVFGLSTKSIAFWDILCKGLIDGGLAVLCYDSVIAKVKKALQKNDLQEEVGQKVDAVLGISDDE